MGVCLHRGIEFSLQSLSPLRDSGLVATTASALNQPRLRMALERRLKTNSYRVLKHGTHARIALPSFHTPNSSNRIVRSSAEEVRSRGLATALPYTESPSYRTPVHRVAKHVATAHPYTGKRANTVISYTARASKVARSLGVPTDNCTKLRSKLYNRRVDAFLMRRGGAS